MINCSQWLLGLVKPYKTGLINPAPNPAELTNPGICNLPKSLSFYSSFSEEEEDFIIVRILTLWNTKCRNKLGL